jgi:NACHT domain
MLIFNISVVELMSLPSSKIIQDIDTIRKAGLGTLAFFYFNFRDDEKKNYRVLLTSLLIQLCDQSDVCCNLLSNLYSRLYHSQGPSDDALTQCLMDMLEHPEQPPTYIIVDGLDECPDTSGRPSPREKVLTLVERLVNLRLPNLRLCITSRPTPDIQSVLNPLTSFSVSLHDEEGQRQDIMYHVRSVVLSDAKMRRWKEADKELVIDVLSLKAHGM